MVGTKIVVEVDVRKAIAEGVGGGRPTQHGQAGAQTEDLRPISVVSEYRDALVVFRTARASTCGYSPLLPGRLMATLGVLNAFAATGENPISYVVRHMNLDPGSARRCRPTAESEGGV